MRQELHRHLARFGQEHLLAGWEQLSPAEQVRFAAELRALDLPLLQQLYLERTAEVLVETVPPDPPEIVPLPESLAAWQQWEDDRARGEERLRAGRVAIVLVAGGQGTRLGHEGPKGTYPLGPITGRSLFQMHAEKVLALSRRYEQPLPLAVMTSLENDAATRAYFAEQRWFGLEPQQVTFFTQGMLPALDAATGRVLLAAPGQLALSPNGHGGVLPALRDAGLLDAWEQRGIEDVFYFQVDNPLVKMADPVFLGAAARTGSEAAVKVVRKVDPEERIGLVVRRRDGRLGVLEYSELPADWASARASDGGLRLWAGSTAIHVFALPFLQRLARQRTVLPYHRALKVVPHLGDPAPQAANAIKFEMFIFDTLPLAERVLVMETARAEEFEPLKNAHGPYSPDSVRAALVAEFARWIEGAGGRVPRDDAGRPSVPIEVSPLYALDAEELRGKFTRAEPITAPLWLGPDHVEPQQGDVDDASQEA
jgi:UDP-N-acetylglucosamine/UDP-N-acetylgalactosamine diphosphorylase